MKDINLVIRELQVALSLLEFKDPDKKRLKATLNQALVDLKAAIVATTGDNPGGGDT